MNGMWGADPDELEALAASMARRGGQLQGIAREVHGLYARDIWRGADAQLARYRWESGLRQRLDAVGRALEDCQTVLMRQAREQREASGAGPSSVGAGPQGASGERVNPFAALSDSIGRLGMDMSLAEKISHLLGKAGRVGDYSDFYRTITGAFTKVKGVEVIPNFFRFKESPVLQFFGAHLDGHAAFVSGVHGLADKASSVLGVVGSGVGYASAVDDLAHGKVAEGLISASDATSGLLKSSKNPVTYMAGAALSAVTMAGEDAMKVDFSSQGIATTNAYVAQHPEVILEGIGDALTQLPGMLGRVFL